MLWGGVVLIKYLYELKIHLLERLSWAVQYHLDLEVLVSYDCVYSSVVTLLPKAWCIVICSSLGD